MKKLMTICGAIACLCLTLFLIQALAPREIESVGRPAEVFVGFALVLSGVIFLQTATLYGFKNGIASLNWFHRIMFLGLSLYIGRFLLGFFGVVAA
ncbi:MAG: hypothetical protein EOP88_05795 [Verrucomicrobiaceae bacterium]|nr:MAG: hypothetical protein EOP88_05795 [Verrucomicrobiaceae bacterium]